MGDLRPALYKFFGRKDVYGSPDGMHSFLLLINNNREIEKLVSYSSGVGTGRQPLVVVFSRSDCLLGQRIMLVPLDHIHNIIVIYTNILPQKIKS